MHTTTEVNLLVAIAEAGWAQDRHGEVDGWGEFILIDAVTERQMLADVTGESDLDAHLPAQWYLLRVIAGKTSFIAGDEGLVKGLFRATARDPQIVPSTS